MGNVAGQLDLKALALRFLQRDSGRDGCGTNAHSAVPDASLEGGTLYESAAKAALLEVQELLQPVLDSSPSNFVFSTWLEKTHPGPATRIAHLFDQLGREWTAQVPIETFCATCRDWVQAHRDAVTTAKVW
jgi:hypothetical protein